MNTHVNIFRPTTTRATDPAVSHAATAAAVTHGQDPLALLRLVMHANLHPEDGLHPSWLPANWPARHRGIQRLNDSGRQLLGQVLRHEGVLPNEADYRYDARLKRLTLLDGASLRRLAAYVGLCAHLPLLRLRGAAGTQMRRQARRIDDDAVEFVLERCPVLTELRMDTASIVQRPWSCGRVVLQRGHRLLMGTLVSEGPEVLQRAQRKLPRRLSLLPVPALSPRQLQQMTELVLLCIVPERFAAWDWLF